MARVQRVDVGGEVYHILNRANARVTIFEDEKDYKQFEEILEEAVDKFKIKLLAYCIMPNHFHLVLHTNEDGDLSKFMRWFSNTHTRRWHTVKESIGNGHLYQGRYKSFICQKDNHLLVLLRYVERNPKRARLVRVVEDWRWSSVWRREHGTDLQKKILSNWPIPYSKDYLKYLNEPEDDIESIQTSIHKNMPFGGNIWKNKTVVKYKIEQSIKNVGRPKKNGD